MVLFFLTVAAIAQPYKSFKLYYPDSTLKVHIYISERFGATEVSAKKQQTYSLNQNYYDLNGNSCTLQKFCRENDKSECFKISRKIARFHKEWIIMSTSKSETYMKLIKDADDFLKKSDFKKANRFYKKALKIKPDEEYPAKKIIEINLYVEKSK